MRKLDLKVWYDTDKLKWGDSMREKVDRGLSKSKYGVVVLSPNYIAEHKYWTKAELNGLFQVETINGKTILPIWHNLTKKQVVEYSPIIADRKAMTTASIINTFLESYNLTGKTIIPFATSGGSGMGKTNERLKPSCPNSKLLEGKVFKERASKADLAEWVDSLKI